MDYSRVVGILFSTPVSLHFLPIILVKLYLRLSYFPIIDFSFLVLHCVEFNVFLKDIITLYVIRKYNQQCLIILFLLYLNDLLEYNNAS